MTAITTTTRTANASASLRSTLGEVRTPVVQSVLLALILTVVVVLVVIPEGMR